MNVTIRAFCACFTAACFTWLLLAPRYLLPAGIDVGDLIIARVDIRVVAEEQLGAAQRIVREEAPRF